MKCKTLNSVFIFRKSLADLLSNKNFYEKINHIDSVTKEINRLVENYLDDDVNSDYILNKELARFYEYDFNVELSRRSEVVGNNYFFYIKSMLEKAFISKTSKQFIDSEIINEIPKKSRDFFGWMKNLIRTHPSFSHPFYTDFLRNKSNQQDIKFYLAQESVLDPRFDDLLALIQIGLPNQMKMEIASNYWDELGRGNYSDIHSYMFSKTLDKFDVTTNYINNNILLSSSISGNLSSYIALHRGNAYKALGYFAVTEYEVPTRFTNVIAGAKRLGIEKHFQYHQIHIAVDARHANGWFKNLVLPLVVKNHDYTEDIVRGALLRLNSSLYYLDEIYSVLPL